MKKIINMNYIDNIKKIGTNTGLSPRTMRVIGLNEIRSPKYFENEEKYGNAGCLICGKPIKEDNKKYWVHLTIIGDICEDNGEIKDEANGAPEEIAQGWFEVGRTCFNKFRKSAHIESTDEYIEKAMKILHR